jgi:hypothetical protein
MVKSYTGCHFQPRSCTVPGLDSRTCRDTSCYVQHLLLLLARSLGHH